MSEQAGRSPSARSHRLLFAAVALGGLAVDAATKALAVTRLQPGEPVSLLGGLLTLRLIRNPGAAFSMFVGYTYVLALLAIVVLGFVVIRLVPRLRHAGWAVALGFLAAGVAGNLLDRLIRPPGVLRGHVVDFLQLPNWPIFNVADMCICAAAVLILFLAMVRNVGLDGVRYAKEPKAKPQTPETPGSRAGQDPSRTADGDAS